MPFVRVSGGASVPQPQQPPLQPQQPPNFSGATTLVPSSGQMQQQAAGGNLNTVRTVPNNLHNLGAMPAQTSSADPNVVVTTHHTFAESQPSH